MAYTQLLILALAFAGTAGISFVLMRAFGGNTMGGRLAQAVGEPVAQSQAQGEWRARVLKMLSPAGRVSLPSEGWEKSPVRQLFIQAGIRSEQATLLFFATKTLLAVALPAAYMLAMGIKDVSVAFNTALAAMVWLAAVGYYAPNVYLRRRVAARQREIFDNLPDAIDLMTVMVEAGLGLDAAINRVAQEVGLRSEALEEELKLVGLELRAGASRDQALRNFAARTGVDEVDLLVAMLVQADRFGTSLAESLRVHSEALRTKRRQRAEEAAAKIPLKLLFPLIFCIFPSIMIVLMGPAAITIYRVFIKFVAAH